MSENSTWYEAEVISSVQETPTVKTLEFKLPHPISHIAGQHYELRLTAEDGYQAARLYSVASVPDDTNTIQLTIARLPDGEVSPYVTDMLQPGDKVEIRGPLGKFFTWDASMTDPVLLIGGGSGVVPMRSIVLAHAKASSPAPVHLLYSAREYDEIFYKDELLNMPNVTVTLTGEQPEGWQGESGRIDANMVHRVLEKLPENPLCYVCGMTPFVEAVAGLLVDMGIPPARIKAERFGA